jgi:hypothetical protein
LRSLTTLLPIFASGKSTAPFPVFAPLYTKRNERGKQAVLIGRGTARGEEIRVGKSLKGWQWGQEDNVRSWGTNTVGGIAVGAEGVGDTLRFTFDARRSPNEAAISAGDSGGGVFIKDKGAWRLAGVNYGVEKSVLAHRRPPTTPASPPPSLTRAGCISRTPIPSPGNSSATGRTMSRSCRIPPAFRPTSRGSIRCSPGRLLPTALSISPARSDLCPSLPSSHFSPCSISPDVPLVGREPDQHFAVDTVTLCDLSTARKNRNRLFCKGCFECAPPPSISSVAWPHWAFSRSWPRCSSPRAQRNPLHPRVVTAR